MRGWTTGPTLFGPLPGLRVGICWQGSRTHASDHNRSLPFEEFAPLITLTGVSVASLQKGYGEEQALGNPLGSMVQQLALRTETYAETAAIVRDLDVVISCDTSVAHLTAGMGKETWVLLSDVPEWRWFLERDDSPWYPSVRLFRQNKLGDWPGVMDQVREALVERRDG